MKTTGPIEAKVGAASLAALTVTALFACASFYHWFTPPPPYLTGLLITAVTGVAGWLAPHTSRAAVKTPLVLTADEAAAIKKMLASVKVMPFGASGAVLQPVDSAPIGRGGYQGGKPASEMPPPPADVPSVSLLPPAVQPPATTTGPTP